MSGYEVKHETIALGATAFVIRSLLNNQQYDDADGAAELAGISSATWPLFGLIWPSARILAGAMQTHVIADKRILEIGCGLALASLVIHKRLGDVTASDRHPLAASFLARNLVLNDLPEMKYQTGHWDRDNPALGLFDLIIASDVLYERDQPGTLSQFISRHAKPAADIMIIDPDRGHRSAFCRKMDGLGFDCNTTRAPSVQSTGEAFKGHVMSFNRDQR